MIHGLKPIISLLENILVKIVQLRSVINQRSVTFLKAIKVKKFPWRTQMTDHILQFKNSTNLISSGYQDEVTSYD